MATEQIKSEISAAWELDTDALYRHLGMASLGTISMEESKKSMSFVLAHATSMNAAASEDSFLDRLLDKGKALFDWMWSELKGAVCEIYNKKTPIGDAKDLAEYIATGLILAGKTVNPVVTIVVVIAVRKGLDALCPVPAVSGS